MLELGHFAVGLAGGLVILMLKPKLVKDYIRNDVFFLFFSGIFALIPDIPRVFGNFCPYINRPWMNIFWFHTYLDSVYVTHVDEINATVFALSVLMIIGALYYRKVHR